MNPPTGTTDGITLYAHQERLVEELPRYRIISWQVGVGKTLASIALANRHDGAGSVLAVVPKGLVSRWEGDMRRYCAKPWLVLSKEKFKKLEASLPTCGCLILDEAHNFFGVSSALSKAARRYAKRPGVFSVLALTGTPFRGDPWNVYVAYELLGRHVSYWDFRRRYFFEIKMGGRTVPKVRESALPALRQMLAEVSSIVQLSDCVDVPEQVRETIVVDKTPEQARAIAQLEEWEPLARCIREQQLMGGVGEGGVPVPTAKDDALLSALGAAPRAIVVAKFRGEMDRLERDVLPTLGRPIGVIHGDVVDREAVLARLRSEPEFVLLVNAQTCEGWELGEADTMIFYSRSWSIVSNVQAEGRVQRITRVKRNAYISLVVADSIDEDVALCVDKKRDFTEKLYNERRATVDTASI